MSIKDKEELEKKWRDEFEKYLEYNCIDCDDLSPNDIYIAARTKAQIEIDTLTSQLEKAEKVIRERAMCCQFYAVTATGEGWRHKKDCIVCEYFKNKEQL